MGRRTVALPIMAVIVATVFGARPALATCGGAFGPNTGSARVASTTTADGVKATVDLEHDADIAAGRTIVHPLQWLSNDPINLNDFVGFGTYRGQGTSGGTSQCASNFAAGWHVYFDGQYFGNPDWYFCHDHAITLGDSATGNVFKIIRANDDPSCDSVSMCAFLNGNYVDKQYIDNTSEGQVAAGGEVLPGSPAINYQNRVHYYNVQKHKAGVGWSQWGGGTTYCDDPYTVDVVQQYNFYPEKP